MNINAWTQIKLVFVVLVWGVNYKILPIGVKEFGAPAFTLLRFALTFPLLVPAVKLAGSVCIERSNWASMITIGVIGTTLYQVMFAQGVAMTTAINAAVLIAISPIFSFVLATVFRGARHSPTNWAGLFIALAGAVLVISRGDLLRLSSDHLAGDAVMLLASFHWALYSFVAEPLTNKYGDLVVTCWSLLPGIIGLAMISASSLSEISWVGIFPATWWSLAFAVTLVTSMGLVFFYQAIQIVGAQRVMLYMFLVPVAAMLSAALFFGESLTIAQAVAALIVVMGVYLTRKPAPISTIQAPTLTSGELNV
jgi:drug/metabolite transporter (DMT)-like permease